MKFELSHETHYLNSGLLNISQVKPIRTNIKFEASRLMHTASIYFFLYLLSL